ncbi:MAG TPA: MBL fold metallo-hydrolase [Dinghuibacter sp.]|uniref:MBL fold metallo-hydrolase n=1 Tax=Dinghuibacter sp. TaxID=2024697 RepID=UPI002C5D0512|nr:MBL fold metallo-hydrolase [Dinghuibacter sp.]HTJ14855.1 MBL fold metallo-hydrolase [Dinghuibacter sp.]
MRYPKRLLPLVALLTVVFGAAQAQSKLKVTVFTSGPQTLQTNTALIEGAHFLLLVDAPMTKEDQDKVIEKIKASGKTLMAVFVTTAAPEHYFGLGAIKAAFPHCKVWSIPQVITGVNANFTNDVALWKPILGATGVPEKITQIFPAPAASILLDNEEIQIGTPLQGSTPGVATLFIGGNKTLFTGDIAYDNVYPWVAGLTANQRRDWAESLDKLKKMNPLMVVAGHKDPSAQDDVASIDGTANYLKIYEKAVKQAHSSDELIGIMQDQFPDLKGSDTALKAAAVKQFPDQN